MSCLALNVIEELAEELLDRVDDCFSVYSLIVSVEYVEGMLSAVRAFFLAIVETLHDADTVEEMWAAIQPSHFILDAFQADWASD